MVSLRNALLPPALTLLVLIALPASVRAQAECWDYSQGPIWREGVNDNGISAISVEGNRLYRASTGHYEDGNSTPPRLTVMDISNAWNPVTLGSVDLQFPDGSPIDWVIWDICVDGNRLLLGTEEYLLLYDVGDPSAIQQVGDAFFYEKHILAIDIKDDLAVITTLLPNLNEIYSLRSINIADPANPYQMDYVQLAYKAEDLEIKGNYVLVANGANRLSIWSLQDPSNLTLVDDLLGSWSYSNIVVEGNLAFLGGNGMLSVFDVSQPLSTILLDEKFVDATQLATDGERIFGLSFYGNLAITDVNPDGTLGETRTAAGPGLGADLAAGPGGIAYSASYYSGLQIFDPRDGPSVTTLGSYVNPDWFESYLDLVLRDPYAAVLVNNVDFGHEGGLIKFYDTADPDNITLLNTLDIGAESSRWELEDLALCDQTLCVANGSVGLLLYDWSDLANPVFSGIVTSSDSIDHVSSAGSMAYASAGTFGVIPMDLSDPSSPLVFSTIVIPGRAKATFAQGIHLYVINESSLFLIDVSDPGNPTQIGSIDLPQTPQVVTAQGHYAYVAGRKALYVIDNIDPGTPQLAASLDLPGSSFEDDDVRGIFADFPNIYLDINGSGLFVVDVSDAADPILTGSHVPPYGTMSLALGADHLVLTGEDILQMLPKACASGSAVGDQPSQAADRLALSTWPNPFNPAASISFDLPDERNVQLDVYDLSGRLVAHLSEGTLGAGRHQLTWQGRDDRGREMPSGVYFVRLQAGNLNSSRRMVMIR